MAWRPNIQVAGQQSKASPALAAFDGGLYMVHLGDSSNDIWFSVFDGQSWSQNEKVPGQQSKASPALAAFDGGLYMVHLGHTSTNIWYSSFSGQYWSGDQKVNPGQQSKASPALGVANRQLYMVHLGQSSNNIWYSEFDPAYVPPRCDLWADAPTVSGDFPGESRRINGVGHRLCEGTDPRSVRVSVRLRKHNRFWFDKTLSETSDVGTSLDVPVHYDCTGAGHQTVFTEVIERDGRKAQSAKVNITYCS